MTIGQIGHQSSTGESGPIDIFVIETFIPHPFGKCASIGGETGNTNAEMVVNFEYFLLMSREFRNGAFECADDGVGGGSEGDAGRALFH